MRTQGFAIAIIGAGSAGSVLAARLSENAACSVALLEAGDKPTDPDIADPLKWPLLQGRSYDWNYLTEPQPGTANRRHSWPRGRIVGGSSSINAMAHVRGHPDDFSVFAEAGGPRWSYEALLPAFRASESFSGGASKYHGDGGPLDVLLPGDELSPLVQTYIEAAHSCGAPSLGDHNGYELAGTAPNSLTLRNGRRLSSADAYLAPALSRPNLTLFTNCLVDRLLLAGPKTVGAIVRINGVEQTIHADQIVLAAGTIASPLILMRSGIGDERDLKRHNIACRDHRPAVGANLHDHLLAFGNIYLSSRPVPPSRLQHSESLTYLHSADISCTTGAPDIVVGCATVPIFSDDFEPSASLGEAYTLFCGVTHPTSRGRLTVSSADPAAAPLIDPAYLSTQHDRDKFRASLTVAREIGHATPFKEWRERELLPGPDCNLAAELDDFLARAASTHHHPVGTCRMGSDDQSVVDGDLKLRGTQNVFVVDASIFPSITTGPVNAAIIAIAESWSRRAMS